VGERGIAGGIAGGIHISWDRYPVTTSAVLNKAKKSSNFSAKKSHFFRTMNVYGDLRSLKM